jgi:hypothetical protein
MNRQSKKKQFVQAVYVSGSCDGFSDRFSFTIGVDASRLSVGKRLTFALRFHCLGQQFWDNNLGRNYVFHCVPSSSQQNLHLAPPPTQTTAVTSTTGGGGGYSSLNAGMLHHSFTPADWMMQ